MTRENKVALVVGFALVLLVGVLISDHLSAARTQESAQLLPPGIEPAGLRLTERELMDLQGVAAPPPQPVTQTLAQATLAIETPVPATATVPEPGWRPEPAAPAPSPAAPIEPPAAEREHQVKPGETLSEICLRHYGDVSLSDELARYNGLGNPNALRAGHRLRLPATAELGRPARTDMPPPEPESRDTYEVRPGDTLTEIAARLLGSSAKWEQLYEANRGVIDDPDRVRAGTVLRIP